MEFKKGDIIQVLETEYTIVEKIVGLKGVIQVIPITSLEYYIVMLEYPNKSIIQKYLDYKKGEFRVVSKFQYGYKIGDKIQFLEGSYDVGCIGTILLRFMSDSGIISYYVMIPNKGTIAFSEFYLSSWSKLVSKLFHYGI